MMSDDHASVQEAFLRKVSAAFKSITRSTNPSNAEYVLIVFLHNAEIMNTCQAISANLRSLIQKGKQLYFNFKKER